MQDKINDLLNGIPVPSIFIDNDLRHCLFNEEAQKLFKISDSQQTLLDQLFTLPSIKLIEAHTKNEQLNFTIEVFAINTHKEVIPCLASAKKITDGHILSFMPHFNSSGPSDNQEENLFHEISDEYIILFMENDQITFISNTLKTILGYDPSSLLRLESLRHIIHPDDVKRILSRRQIVREQKTSQYSQVFRARHKDGYYLWLEAKVKRSYHEAADFFKSIIRVKDITKRIQYEQALIDAKHTAEEAVNYKNQFLSEVSHDIRTPMNTIIGISHLLLNKSPRKDQAELIKTIRFSGDNLLSLINDILDFSKIQANRIEFEDIEFDLKSLINSLKIGFKIPAEAKGLDFRIRKSGSVPDFVKGDSVRLNQILNNLISNAIKFTSEGKVTIDLTAKELADKNEITFSVKDTGIGIAEDKLEEIFEPYKQASRETTRKYGGTGLGLTIMKKLVELQGGQIQVNSTPGKGSEFIVVMSFGKAKQVLEDITDEMDLSEISILYVEDVISNQMLMRGLCSMWNISLDVAATGERAQALLNENHYNMLLVDLQLPDIHGKSLVQNLRKNSNPYLRDIPVIAVTGEATEGLMKELISSGFNDLVMKPFQPDKLIKKICQLTGSSQITYTEKALEITAINFELLDSLYREKKSDYLDLIRLLKIEYQKYFEVLQYSIEKRDLKGVRKIVHKMLPNLKALGLVDFIDYLEDLKQQMRSSPTEFNKKTMVRQLNSVQKSLNTLLDSKEAALDPR